MRLLLRNFADALMIQRYHVNLHSSSHLHISANESATPCHDAQVVGPYLVSSPIRVTNLAAKSEDHTTAPRHLHVWNEGRKEGRKDGRTEGRKEGRTEGREAQM